MFMSAIKPAEPHCRAAPPTGCGEDLGIYAYVGNDPVNFTDPLGLQQHPAPPPPPPPVDDEIVVTGQLPGCDGIRIRGLAGGGSVCVGDFSVDIGSLVDPANLTEGLVSWISNGETVCSVRPAQSSPAQTFGRHAGALGLGIGDAFTFGFYSDLWSSVPGNDVSAQHQTYAYDTTFKGATALSLGRLAYAGIAKTFTLRSGSSAVAARNSLKGTMSLLGSAHPRMYTYGQMHAKYGSDRAVAAAAGRTNPRLNGAAAVGATSGTTTGRGC